MTAPAFAIRPCVEADSSTLAELVRELAVYEKLENLARAGADDFRTHLFGPRAVADAIVAEVAGTAAGFALFYPTFSTFRGQPGCYLEDLFVRPDYRGHGLGRALIATVAKLAVQRGCGRLEWAVLDWNSSAIAFYESAGARPLDDWKGYRIDDEPLARLAGSAPEEFRKRPG